MSKRLTGIIRGRMIELAEDPGLAEGAEVEVVVPDHLMPEWGAGILRSAGALADDWTEADDLILAEIEGERKRSSRREIEG